MKGKVKEKELTVAHKKLKNLETEYTQNSQINKDLADRNRTLNDEIRKLKTQISQMERQTEGWHITDHALLRYIERKYKLPVDKIRQEILTTLKDYNWGDTDNCMGFVVRGNSIITYRNKNGSQEKIGSN